MYVVLEYSDKEADNPIAIANDCSCSDYITENGFGRCQKIKGISPMCFVNEPSSCSDLVSTSFGVKYSWEACTNFFSKFHLVSQPLRQMFQF